MRIVDFDPLDQCVHSELRASEWRDGALVAEEQYSLDMRVYFKDELVLMLERAGFGEVSVRGGHTDRAPSGDDETLVYVARK